MVYRELETTIPVGGPGPSTQLVSVSLWQMRRQGHQTGFGWR